MMKRFLIIFFLILNGIAFGQINESKDIYCHFPTKPSVEINKIYENPDEIAEFPCGLNAFRLKFIQAMNYKSEACDVIKTTITFVVEKDGTFTDLKASGRDPNFNNDAIKAMKTITYKWKPAKYNGLIVRSLYRFPITVSFE